MTLSRADRDALALAADLLRRINRVGLANRLREIAYQQQPKVQRPEERRRHAGQRPTDEMGTVAAVLRGLNDEDLYALFRVAATFRPSNVTAYVWHRVAQLRGE